MSHFYHFNHRILLKSRERTKHTKKKHTQVTTTITHSKRRGARAICKRHTLHWKCIEYYIAHTASGIL